MNLAEQLKDTVNMLDVVAKYGFSLDRNRRMICPFHKEKTPSFQVHKNERSWKCYGCGEGGTVIDFIMKLFGISFSQAIARINYDFGLGLSAGRPSIVQRSKIATERRHRQQQEQDIRHVYNTVTDEYRRLGAMSELPFDEQDEYQLWLKCDIDIRIKNLEEILDYYYWEGEAEWWKRYGSLLKTIF